MSDAMNTEPDPESWEIRIYRHEDAAGVEYGFAEVYMDADGNVVGHHDHAVAGESLHELHGSLQRLLFMVSGAIARSKPPQNCHNVWDLPAPVATPTTEETT